ncbi:uncharacterized protein LOC108680225 [Hyalella azteca]|uniref:Uncharacterized protein LOC108680225 n=1 Tax=Hyalella azteca TaxID=294128 RepID=A0A8B7PED5_HYAAZ|nr:uncharacterized protein LOC108680225 [Hyalella azteca]
MLACLQKSCKYAKAEPQRSQNDQTRYLQFRITTRRPTTRPTGILLDNLQPSYVPRYIKEDITEVEYEPRLVTTHKVDPHWFLMPVQAWFVLSIVLAALFIVLVVIVVLLYRTIRKQKKKIRKLVISSRCGDPLHHEMCNCRRGISVASPYLGPLGRSLDGLGTLGRPIDGTLGRPIDGRYNGELSGTLQLAATTCRDSAVSRNSLRGATLANSKTKDSPAHLATLQRGSLQRATLQRGSNFHAQSYDQPTTINIGNGRRLQTTDMIEHDRDALRDVTRL